MAQRVLRAFGERREFSMSPAYSFRRVTADDLAMLRRWLETPEVRRWWDDPAVLEENFGDDRIAMWIVSLADRPFAYVQDYKPHDWSMHHFAFLPGGARGIDQFIGEPDMIGRGHGSAFIRAHVDQLFAEGAPAVGVDPDPENIRAIRAYQKAGFVAGDAQDTEWGPSLLMVRWAEERITSASD
jgi:aminoglycoside 6'-N-acetyltransferase